jgi:hypothetical protein
MNKERRKVLREVIATLEAAQEALDAIREQEDEAFNAMPEPLQQSDKGQTMESAIGTLETASDEIGSAISNINEACDG